MGKPMLKAIIFDFDGVIADSENLHYEAFKQTFLLHGFEFPRQDYWDSYLGFTDSEVFEQAGTKYNVEYNLSAQGLIDQKAEIFDRLARTTSSVYPGISDFIRDLLAAGKRCAICSGAIMSDINAVFEIEKIATGEDMAILFETIVTAEHVSRGKPAPDGYLLAAKQLNDLGEPLKISECLVIEDSVWGLMSARDAGMKTLAVTNTYPAEQLTNYTDMTTDKLSAELIPQMDKLFT